MSEKRIVLIIGVILTTLLIIKYTLLPDPFNAWLVSPTHGEINVSCTEMIYPTVGAYMCEVKEY